MTQTIDTNTVSDVATPLVPANNIVINRNIQVMQLKVQNNTQPVGTRIITSDTNRINGATIIKNNRTS